MRQMQQRRLSRRVRKLAPGMRLRDGRHAGNVDYRARHAGRCLSALVEEWEQGGGEEVVAGDVAGVGGVPCFDPVAGHPG